MRAAFACATLALLSAWPSAAQEISARETHAWDETLSRIAPAVVTIEIDQTRAFDTEWNQSSQATGFVVDSERGLILTNRHVVTPGPVVAMAVFQNREEVELSPVYRRPGARKIASTTRPSSSTTRSFMPQVRSQPLP